MTASINRYGARSSDSEPALVTYVIAEKDIRGPFIQKVPEDYREKASLTTLSYSSIAQLLAEKFHMSEQLLKQFNPNAAFVAGTEIVSPMSSASSFPARLRASKCRLQASACLLYDKDDRLVAVYPATVGSSERPSPAGDLKVTAIAENPTYHYDPSLNSRH